MPDSFDYDQFEDDSDGGSKLVSDLRKQLKAAAKERDDARKQLDEALKSVQQVKARNVLDERGVNAKVARFLIADGVDIDDAKAVDGWLDENGDLFGVQRQPQPQDSPPEQQSLRRMNSAEDAGVPANTLEALRAAVNKTTSGDELTELLRASQAQLRGATPFPM